MAEGTRRDAILLAAIAEFAAYGLAGARVARIAAAARANKQLIFHYFDSKDGLYEAALAHLFSAAPAPPPGGLSATENLRLTVSNLSRWLESTRGAARAIVDPAPHASSHGEVPVIPATWLAGVHRTIRDAVDDGQRKGFFRDNVDSQAVAQLAIGAALGDALLRQRSTGTPADEDSFATKLGQVILDFCAWR